jgi:5'-nucleotidase / UDP-sugar diphosphatase
MYRNLKTLTLGVVVALVVASLSAARAEPIGNTGTEISGVNSRTQETTAGNLCADAIRAATRADAAILPGGSINSATIPAGQVRTSAVRELLSDPDDEIAVLALTGAQLRATLERGVSFQPRPFPGFLQVSGMVVTFDASRPAGSRIVSVVINGAAVQDSQRYRIATVSSLAGGALGYFNIWKPREDVTREGGAIFNVVNNYIRAQGNVAPRAGDRIVSR